MASKKKSDTRKGQGGSRSGSETRKRAPIIGFRATDQERAKIEADARRAGLTVGSYVRSRALKRPETRAVRRPAVETTQLAQLLGMVGAVAGTMQKMIQKHGGESAIPPADLAETMAVFRES